MKEVKKNNSGVPLIIIVLVLAGVVFGVLPLIQRFDLALLRDSGRGLTMSRRGMGARRVLVASQMSLAVVGDSPCSTSGAM